MFLKNNVAWSAFFLKKEENDFPGFSKIIKKVSHILWKENEKLKILYALILSRHHSSECHTQKQKICIHRVLDFHHLATLAFAKFYVNRKIRPMQ